MIDCYTLKNNLLYSFIQKKVQQNECLLNLSNNFDAHRTVGPTLKLLDRNVTAY